MTKGQYRVGTTFNPSNSGIVASIKQKAAELIDLIDEIPIYKTEKAEIDIQTASANSEIQRCKAIAQTDVETAAMYAVKAATKQKND